MCIADVACFPLICMMLLDEPVSHWLVEIPKVSLSFATRSYDKVRENPPLGWWMCWSQKMELFQAPHVVEPFLMLATVYEDRGEMEKLV